MEAAKSHGSAQVAYLASKNSALDGSRGGGFVSEADPSSGQVNCAVEPSRSNALARLLYQNNC